MLKLTHLYLTEDQKKALTKIAIERADADGGRISMAEVVREAIDRYLAQRVPPTQGEPHEAQT